MIKAQWAGARLRREVASLETVRAALERRVSELESAMPQETQAPVPLAEDAAPYVGLKALLTGHEERKTT